MSLRSYDSWISNSMRIVFAISGPVMQTKMVEFIAVKSMSSSCLYQNPIFELGAHAFALALV